MTTLNRLDKVVTEWGIADDMIDPVVWLQKQIRSGRIQARKIGRHWYMTDADVEAALDVFASKPAKEEAPTEPVRRGLSAASARRRTA